jgi:hypothetical protein
MTTCESRKNVSAITHDHKFSFALSKDGIYAVLFNPSDPEVIGAAECNWIC